MKRSVSILLIAVLLLSIFVGCKEQDPAPVVSDTVVSDSTTDTDPKPIVPVVYEDGRARPSTCGTLQVIDGKLCSESGEPAMLRGFSTYEILTAENYFNDTLFAQLSGERGVNVFRLAMYTFGVGGMGYCSGADKERLKTDIDNAIQCAKNHDMYAIIDWHILSDGNPNMYIEDAKEFFADMAEKYCDYNNVLYEICNEPNRCEWPDIKSYAEVIIPIIREKDPDSVIIVGTPDYSKRVDDAAKDPLEFDNILYTFHFYAATHYEDWRAVLEEASINGLPIFVTEFGICSSNAGYPIDIESSDTWIELLEREGISYCMWSFCNIAEAQAAIKYGVLKSYDFTDEDFSESGHWLFNTIKKYNTQ